MKKMKYGKIMFILVLSIFLFSIANVWASDVNDTTIVSEGNSVDLSQAEVDENISAEENSQENEDLMSEGNVGTFTELQLKINAATSGSTLTLNKNYEFDDGFNTEGISIDKSITIDGNGSKIDAKEKSRIFKIISDNVILKNIIFTNAKSNGYGGAIFATSSVTVSNCNFTNNSAMYGSAVYFGHNNGGLTNCNFTGNKATEDGGAIFFGGSGEVTNCNFTDNSAADEGGAVYFSNYGEVINCNFTSNTALSDGGAVWIFSGSMSNCNFINSSSSKDGGAVWIFSGSMSNCNFTGNTASEDGGAIFARSSVTVLNCNFTGNTASGDGGAIKMNSGSVENCNFTDNKATGTNSWGGAVYFSSTGNVSNCNFIGNSATNGSAIYFFSTSDTKTVSNSLFLNNRANAEALEVTKNENNITINFIGNDNLLNAIYSRNDAEVTFSNVTYWGANVINNTDSSTIKPSKNEAGQNITVGVIVNGILVFNEVKVTDENGMIVLDIKAGENYYIAVRHDTDSYYTEAEKTISNMNFSANVTSVTTHNKTVNITAKSNIFSEVMPGKLLFVLPGGIQINADYAGNGTWWALHTFDDYSEYNVSASYPESDNVTVSNATIIITRADSEITFNKLIFDYGDSINVSTVGAVGITAKIDANNVTVVDFTIPLSDLNVGNHTLTVTTIPDDDHNPITKEVTITINKIDSTLTVGDIEFDYGSSGFTVVSFTGADGVKASVVGQSDAVVKVNGTNISVSGLDVGTYTLTVTAVADKNHNNVTKNATITVNRVNASLTVDIVLDW